MARRESQFTQDKSKYNFVSRKVYDRKIDQIERKHAELKQRFRELQASISLVLAALAPPE